MPDNDHETATFQTAAKCQGGNIVTRRPWHVVAIVLLLVPYLYLRLFTRFAVPYLISGDQRYFWQYALRLSYGEHAYRQFFQFTPPGLDLYFLFLFRLFGSHIWVTNLAGILLGLILGLVCFAISLQFMSANESLVTSLLFCVFVYGGHLDVNHHWFSVAASLSAVAVLFKGRADNRVLVAGVFLGVASLFTQSSGVVVAIGISLSFAWERFYGISARTIMRKQALLVVTFLSAWVAMSLYFGWAGGWRNLWYCQFIYPWRYVDAGRGFLLPGFHDVRGFLLVQHLVIYLILPLVCTLVLLGCYRRRKTSDGNDIARVLLASAGLALFLAVIGRVNWARLYPIALPGVILAMSFVTSMKPAARRIALSVIYVAIVCVASSQIWHVHRHGYKVLTLPAGRAAVPNPEVEELCWMQNHTKPDDYLFEATWPSIYLPLGLRSPVFVETLLPDRTPSQFVKLTMDQLSSSQTKYILLSRWLGQHPDELDNNELKPFKKFLNANYARVRVFQNGDEVWQRL